MLIDQSDRSRSVLPVPSPSDVRFSDDGRYAYVVNRQEGTATVIALDGAAAPGPTSV